MNTPSSKTSNSRSKVAVLNVSLKVILSSNFGTASLATGFLRHALGDTDEMETLDVCSIGFDDELSKLFCVLMHMF